MLTLYRPKSDTFTYQGQGGTVFRVYPTPTSCPWHPELASPHQRSASAGQNVPFANPDAAHLQFQITSPIVAESEAALLKPLGLAPGERLLEIGCGQGANLWHLGRSQPGALLFGVDRAAARSALARTHLRRQGLQVQILTADATRLPFTDSYFDAILIRDLLHHVPERILPLREAFRVLRPGGRLLLIEPNRAAPLVLLQMGILPEERGALRSSAARLHAELLIAGFTELGLLRSHPFPISRALLHPRFGFPRPFKRLHPLILTTLRAVERHGNWLVPSTLWLYLCYTATRPEHLVRASRRKDD